MSRWLLLGWFTATLFAVAGCDLQADPERNSGEDKTRLTAIEFPINSTIIDNVNAVRGDTTDWKYFYLPTPDVVELVIAFDNPKARAIVIVREATGLQKTILEHRREPLLKTSFKADAGVYYVQIFAREESTSYTLEVNTE